MDPFSELDDFLNDSNEFTASPSATEGTPNSTHNDSLSFDLSTVKSKKKVKKSSSQEDEDIPAVDIKSNKFVPGKGQKAAFKRLEKIKGLVAETTRKEATVLGSKHKRKASQRNQASQPKSTYDSSDEEDDFETLPTPRQRCFPAMPAFVNLDSDDEYADTPIMINRDLSANQIALQTSENEEVKVLVKFGTKVENYQLRPFQKLSELVDNVAKNNKVKAESIFLMLSGKIISTAESLRSIDYTRGLVICAHVAEKNVATSQNDTKATKAKRDDEIELRVQGASRNKPFVVHIGKSETISSLYFQCAEEFKCKPDKVRLEFDAETLDSKKTAEDYDLEGGEVIDMFIVA